MFSLATNGPFALSPNRASATATKQVIYTVTSPVAGGKTTSAVRWAARAVSMGYKVLIVQPSKLLIDETCNKIARQYSGTKHQSIYSLDDQEPCLPLITQHLKDARADEGEILLITHAAFSRLDYFQNRENWHVIYDELPQIDWSHQFNLAEHRDEFLGLFEDQPKGDSPYSVISPANNGVAQDITRNRRQDRWWAELTELTFRLNSDAYETLVETSELADFIEDKRYSVTAYSMMHPSIFNGFASVTIMSALLEQSIMFKAWADQVEFIPHQHIKPMFQTHGNGHLVEIYYAYDCAGWSKRKRDLQIKQGDEYVRLIDLAVARTNDLFQEEKSVFMANLDQTGISAKIIGSEQLPNSPHGINKFQDRHNVAIFSALNPPNQHFAYLNNVLGVEPDKAADAIYRAAAYQAAGRISIRDLNSQDIKKVVVMDKATADWMGKLFPNSTVKPLPGDCALPEDKKVGRPAKHGSDAARNAANREKIKAELLQELAIYNSEYGGETRETKPPYNRGFVSRDFRVQFFSSIRSNDPVETTPVLKTDHDLCAPTDQSNMAPDLKKEMSQTELLEMLRYFSAQSYASKHEMPLTSPAVYEGKRRTENFQYAQNIWLDNDYDEEFGNGISPKDFAAAFPGLKIYIFNTFSNQPGKQKYRVVIPTKQRMSMKVYKFAVTEIMDRLRKNRNYQGKRYFQEMKDKGKPHTYKFHGFDPTKFTPASLFYVPCQAGAGPDCSFFIEHNPDADDLDVASWIDKAQQEITLPEPVLAPVQAPVPPQPPAHASEKLRALAAHLSATEASKAQNKKDRDRDKAIAQWVAVKSVPGRGNEGFFKLAVRLHRSGHDRYETERILRQQYVGACTEQDRRNQIPYILRTLYG